MQQNNHKDIKIGLMQCTNQVTGKPKKTFKVFEDAVVWAKRMNENSKFIHKQVAYKCGKCLKFHTGRSIHGTLLYHEKNIYEIQKI